MGQDDRGNRNEQWVEELHALRSENAALRERCGHLEAVIEVITDAVYVKDANGRYLIINGAGADLLGRSVEEVIGRDDTELFSPGTAREIMEVDGEIIAEGATRTFEDVATSAGVTRTYLTTKGPYRDDRGHVVGVVGISRDITERKRSEEALHETREFLERLLDHAPALIYVTTRDGRRCLVNRAWEELFQRRREEIIGLSLERVFPPEVARRFQDENQTIIETETPLVLEQVMDAPDGRRHFHTVKFPLRNRAGQVEAVAGFSFDITERNQALDDLRLQKEILQSIFDHVPLMIRLMDSAGRLQLVNRHWEKVLGWSLEEAQNRDIWAELYPDPEDRQQILDFARQSSGSWTDSKVRVRDGRILDTSCTSVLLSDGARIGIGKDITERKREEEALREYARRLKVLSRRVVEVQEEERRHLARELHDEVGQSLTAIGINLKAIRMVCTTEMMPQIDECIGIVHDAIQRIRHLSLDLRPSMLDDLGLVAALRWYLDRQAQRVGYEARFIADPEEVPLSMAVATAAFRVAQEALTNVARHAGARRVWVRLTVRDGVLRLVVRDDGAGFDPEAFHTGEARGERLGLLGMRERAALLGGRVSIRSAPGRGTEVRLGVRLPRPD